MKIIVAGMPKTGTKSMNAALTKLGYSVYDAPENMFLLSDEYNKIVYEGWTTDDFRKMYKNVDAVIDFPSCCFWDEIHKAFPDAKIILTVRKSEEEWLRSLEKQVQMNSGSFLIRFMQLLSPTCRKSVKFLRTMSIIAFGGEPQSALVRNKGFNKQMAQRLYRQHNAYVMHCAPKDKLLVYTCSEGWDPLCKFLEIPVPEEPFPHKNVGGNISKTIADDFPIFRQIRKEVIVSSVCILSSTLFVGVAVHKYGFSGICRQLDTYANRALQKIGF